MRCGVSPAGHETFVTQLRRMPACPSTIHASSYLASCDDDEDDQFKPGGSVAPGKSPLAAGGNAA